MNNSMPRTPVSTALSGSAKETEIRLKNIFSGPKKRPPLPFLALMCAVCLLCGNLVSCNVTEAEIPDQSALEGPPPAKEWINYVRNPEDLPWKGSIETELPEYPGVTFRWTASQVSAVEDGRETVLFSGMPVESVFLWDITGDGLRELCAVTALGSGMVDERVKAYDYATGEAYMLESRGMFDYGLSLEDGQLQVTRYRYAGDWRTGQPLSVGRLAIDSDTELLEGEERYRALRLADEVPVFTGEPDLAYLLMREHHNYPYSAESMFSYLLLSQEGEGCILGLARVNGAQHPAGLGNLMLGLWDTEENAWLGPVYEVGGDDGLFSSWTAEDGSLHILCANTVTYQGDESASTAAHYRFDGASLTELDRWNYEDTNRKAVPAEGGLELYDRNPQYDLQHYNSEYNGVSLPDQWVYSHFEPVTE